MRGHLDDVSVVTEATVGGAEVEGTPNLAVIHLCSPVMPVPAVTASKAEKGFYRHRGGFFTSHKCFPGLIELKQPPSRHTKNRLQEQSAEFQSSLVVLLPGSP